MKRKIKYTDEPIESSPVEDFLPSPAELASKSTTVKVTINLNADSLKAFRKLAEQKHVPYQRLIRNLIDDYATKLAFSERKHKAA
jgi:predicted DNA binding CopG/RHH family protein